jgi:hypothetical protein
MENWRNRKTLILSRTDMMGLLTPDEYNYCVEHAYRMHGEGRYYMDPKGHIVLDKYRQPASGSLSARRTAPSSTSPPSSRSSSTPTPRPGSRWPSATAATTP